LLALFICFVYGLTYLLTSKALTQAVQDGLSLGTSASTQASQSSAWTKWDNASLSQPSTSQHHHQSVFFGSRALS